MAVDTIITESRAYAQSWVTQADGLMAKISELAEQQLDVPALPTNFQGGYSGVVTDLLADFGATPVRPAGLGEIADITVPAVPAAPTFSALAPIAVPEFTGGDAPVLSIPAPPSALNLTAPGDAPEFLAPDMPDVPTLAMPELPTLSEISLPDAPTVEFPVFDRASPNYDIAAPTVAFEFADQAYESVMLDALKVKLLNDLTDGGYGIEAADEEGLWERAKEREMGEGSRAIEEAEQAFASRGFMTPPGALFKAIDGARARAVQAVNTLSREIALKRADMYVENRKFTITEVRSLETTLINMHMSTMERLLNAAKFTAQFAIDLYEARVKELQVRMDGWKSEAQVYGERVRAEVSKLEAFRILMQGAQIRTEVDKSRVDLYRAQLAGVESVVAIYRARLEGAQIMATVEQIKLQAFKTTVDAYAAGVQAKSAEFGMYESRINGEVAKVRAYGESVKAFATRMDGARVLSDIRSADVRLQIEQSAAQLKAHELVLEDARQRSTRQIESARMGLQAYGIDVDAYKTRVGAVGEYGRLSIAEMSANTDVFKTSSDANLRGATLILEKLKAQYTLQAQAGISGAEIYSKMVTGALGALTSIASVSE